MWRHLLTKFASYKVPPVMVLTHGSVVPLAMFFCIVTKLSEAIGHKSDCSQLAAPSCNCNITQSHHCVTVICIIVILIFNISYISHTFQGLKLLLPFHQYIGAFSLHQIANLGICVAFLQIKAPM